MSRLLKLRPLFLAAAVLGLAASAPGLVRRDEAALHGYLIGYLFWAGLSIGSLGLLMVNHTAGGRWGILIRRPLEAAAAALPLCAVLFLPILFGANSLYAWAHSPNDEHIRKISAYLNVPFLAIRAAFYFLIWSGLTMGLRKNSLRQDGGADVSRAFQRISAPGLLVFFLTTTFAFTDWMMSLEPHWYSTIYGASVLVGHAVGALAGAIVVAVLLREESDLRPLVNPARLHQLGNLLFAFVMFWIYLSFCQYFLIWSANLSEEVTWIIRRTTGGWQWLAIGLVISHFALPFFALLLRDVKKRAVLLGIVAAWLVVAHWFDTLWLVAPALRPDGFQIRWFEIASTVGVGGLWLWYVAGRLASRRLVPVGDPRLAEALS